MLRVNLLGAFGVSVDGSRIQTDLGPSGQKMAAFLFAFPGRLHRRERLADIFWPELDSDRSRAALNSAMWRLRKLLAVEPESVGGRNLRSIGPDVVLDTAPWLDVDVHQIDSLFREVRSEDTNSIGLARRWMLQAAVDLYNGPFLEVAEEQIFVEERERIHTNFVTIANVLVRSHVAARSYNEAIKVCRRVLAFDQFRELFVRYLLVLFVLAEQRAEALRFYDAWRTSLQRELGVDPMPGTMDMIRRIRECCTLPQIENLLTSVFAVHELDS
jgi:DNA-binding SARP family transcriptional activator